MIVDHLGLFCHLLSVSLLDPGPSIVVSDPFVYFLALAKQEEVLLVFWILDAVTALRWNTSRHRALNTDPHWAAGGSLPLSLPSHHLMFTRITVFALYYLLRTISLLFVSLGVVGQRQCTAIVNKRSGITENRERLLSSSCQKRKQ